jgi:hypothetical protein
MISHKRYYFKSQGKILFDDIAYADDNPYWTEEGTWATVPGYSLYEASLQGDIVRKRDAFMLPQRDGTVMVNADDGTRQRLEIDELINITYPAEFEPTVQDLLDDLLDDLDDLDESADESTTSTVDTVSEESMEYAEHVNVPVAHTEIDERYLNEYPVVLLTGDEDDFQKWYPSITHMLRVTHGTEGMDPVAIYNACQNGTKCYGKKIIWDPMLYVKFELQRALKERETD